MKSVCVFITAFSIVQIIGKSIVNNNYNLTIFGALSFIGFIGYIYYVRRDYKKQIEDIKENK